jgi:hypothetical protein
VLSSATAAPFVRLSARAPCGIDHKLALATGAALSNGSKLAGRHQPAPHLHNREDPIVSAIRLGEEV